MVGKYLAILNLNKTLYIYIINIALEAPKNSVLEVIGLKEVLD